MNEITVLGIFVADISFSGSKIPSIGETILGKKYNVGPGCLLYTSPSPRDY